ncbi:MAG: UDP-N-acetylmuramoyl-L-alanine--D-glutamate ligase [Clostridiales bacterium]|nr:UDP-N-acetylmuramoyl-L-alanine--D-glutamate ligase [Clostridiales bacterium]
MTNYKDKKVLVCGCARSGISAAKLLLSKGAEVTLQDKKTEKELDLNSDELKGITLFLGENPDEIITGFDLVVLSPGIPANLPFILKAKEAGIEVISEIELAYTLCEAPVVAITGTNGKTTTTALTGEIFSKKYKTETVGNIGVPFSEKVLNLGKNDRAVIENSSFQLENIKTYKPVCAAVLNITPDHLDRHGTVENYTRVKENVFKNMTEDNFLILNAEDEATLKMAEKTKAKVYFFSSEKKVSGVWSDEKSIYVNMLGLSEKLIDIDEMNILGKHNVENAMAAAALGLCGGVEIDLIRQTLREFKAVEHRIEFVVTKKGVDYYNDSKGTNPDAAIKAVYAMKKPICLIGGGYDKHSDYAEWVATFKGRVKYLALIGAVKLDIKAECDRQGFSDYELFDTFEEAVSACENKAEEGDCVLLSPACASWDMFKSYEQRGEIFKDLVRS